MQNQRESSEFVRHEPCPGCCSQDNLARYSDGHAYCFGCSYREAGDGRAPETCTKKTTGLLGVQYMPIRPRGLSEETCKFWSYGISEYSGQTVHVAQYHNKQGEICGQKIRFASKDFVAIGDMKNATLYGQNLWRDGGRMVTVTEGEIDAMTVSQAFAHKWPVVSIPSGAQGALKAFQANLEWLETFDSVVIMFDDDAPGRQAARECALLLSPGKAKIATIPGFKDANEAHLASKDGLVINAVYGAKIYRPDGVVVGSDLWDVVSHEDHQEVVLYPWEDLNDKLLGMRQGELIVLTSGTGIGKSSVCRELVCHLIRQGKKVGLMMLEESIAKTGRSLMGLHMNCPPYFWEDRGVTDADKRIAFDATVANVVLFDHFGSVDPENLLARMRYMAKALGCTHIILDHLSIVVSGQGEGDERRLIDNTMTALRSLVEETQICLFVVSHLRRPDGDRGHENGAQTSLSQLRGSHAIAQLADAVLGMERDQQDQENANTLILRVLKNRITGDTGLSGALTYCKTTGRLSSVEAFE